MINVREKKSLSTNLKIYGVIKNRRVKATFERRISKKVRLKAEYPQN